MTRDQITQQQRDQWAKGLMELRVTGPKAGHDRKTNLDIIADLKQGKDHATMGFTGFDRFSEEQVLGMIAGITKCSSDISHREGPGHIDAYQTVEGLLTAAQLFVDKVQEGSRVVVGTAHPGSLLGLYTVITALVEERQAELFCPAAGRVVRTYLCPYCGTHDVEDKLDYIHGIAVITDGDGLIHTHAPTPMEVIIEAAAEEGTPIDLAVVDHGLAGAAVQKGIPTISVMDTNDAAIAVAHHLYPNLYIIPMDDNLPNYVQARVGQIFEEMVRLFL